MMIGSFATFVHAGIREGGIKNVQLRLQASKVPANAALTFLPSIVLPPIAGVPLFHVEVEKATEDQTTV